jgi:polar amino acid transport system substrate-binding protein
MRRDVTPRLGEPDGRHHHGLSIAGRLAALLVAVACMAAIAACGSGSRRSASTEGTKLVAAHIAAGEITFGTDFTEPPYENIVNGKMVGFDVDFGKLLARQLGLQPHFTDNRFATLIPALQANKFDVVLSSMYITAQRAQVVNFVPYFDTGVVLVVQKGSRFKPTSAIQLCGHTVALNAGSAEVTTVSGPLDAECKKAGQGVIKTQLFPSDLTVLQQVAAGRAQAAFEDPALVRSVIKSDPGVALQISTHAGVLLYPVPVGMALRKNEGALQKRIQGSLDVLERNGKLAALRKRYAISPVSAKLVAQSERGAA